MQWPIVERRALDRVLELLAGGAGGAGGLALLGNWAYVIRYVG